jgi:hypothetical protein
VEGVHLQQKVMRPSMTRFLGTRDILGDASEIGQMEFEGMRGGCQNEEGKSSGYMEWYQPDTATNLTAFRQKKSNILIDYVLVDEYEDSPKSPVGDNEA